jgi:hypothetical protein
MSSGLRLLRASRETSHWSIAVGGVHGARWATSRGDATASGRDFVPSTNHSKTKKRPDCTRLPLRTFVVWPTWKPSLAARLGKQTLGRRVFAKGLPSFLERRRDYRLCRLCPVQKWKNRTTGFRGTPVAATTCVCGEDFAWPIAGAAVMLRSSARTALFVRIGFVSRGAFWVRRSLSPHTSSPEEMADSIGKRCQARKYERRSQVSTRVPVLCGPSLFAAVTLGRGLLSSRCPVRGLRVRSYSALSLPQFRHLARPACW